MAIHLSTLSLNRREAERGCREHVPCWGLGQSPKRTPFPRFAGSPSKNAFLSCYHYNIPLTSHNLSFVQENRRSCKFAANPPPRADPAPADRRISLPIIMSRRADPTHDRKGKSRFATRDAFRDDELLPCNRWLHAFQNKRLHQNREMQSFLQPKGGLHLWVAFRGQPGVAFRGQPKVALHPAVAFRGQPGVALHPGVASREQPGVALHP